MSEEATLRDGVEQILGLDPRPVDVFEQALLLIAERVDEIDEALADDEADLTDEDASSIAALVQSSCALVALVTPFLSVLPPETGAVCGLVRSSALRVSLLLTEDEGEGDGEGNAAPEVE